MLFYLIDTYMHILFLAELVHVYYHCLISEQHTVTRWYYSAHPFPGHSRSECAGDIAGEGDSGPLCYHGYTGKSMCDLRSTCKVQKCKIIHTL